jgi:hypothetical protein
MQEPLQDQLRVRNIIAIYLGKNLGKVRKIAESSPLYFE